MSKPRNGVIGCSIAAPVSSVRVRADFGAAVQRAVHPAHRARPAALC